MCTSAVPHPPQVLLLIHLRFSHYVAAVVLLFVHYKLWYMNWRGYLVAFFALLWVANQYMSIYNRLRLEIEHEQVEIKADEHKVDDRKAA